MRHFPLFLLLLIVGLVWSSCEKDDPNPTIEEPEVYRYERDGSNSVDFSGQTTRILMAEELVGQLKSFTVSEATLLEMYANATPDGGDTNPFSSAELNASSKSIRSKVAASADFFADNTARSALIKQQFADWLSLQANEIFPVENQLASPGQAGQIADGSTPRWINAQGLEYDQLFGKGLIGALMVDQMLNNYLSPAVLDAGNNVEDNDNGVRVDGKPYTAMEHKWDEAYGYLYGMAADPVDPRPTVGSDDSFLNKYLGRVDNDPDYKGISERIFQAFKRGRAAIVAGDYAERNAQAAIIRTEVSKLIAIRAIYYLQQGKNALESGNFGGGFHDLSEGYGFIYSLQFSRQPDKNEPYFTGAEVDDMITDLLNDGSHGLWDVEAATLDAISETIATRFGLSVTEAAG
ncbi:MAG: DUF4856 domain-containing protein [Bacteroidetes bacterium]|nr:MAG: DUF4856 domain-containing protein [Bacteroidota bacterium]